MKDSYLVEIVSVMSPEERDEALVFLKSLWTAAEHHRKEIVKLYELIISAAPTFEDPLLEKKEIYFMVFKDKVMVEGKLEKLMVDLNKALRQFILISNYFNEKKHVGQQVDWIEWLIKKGLHERAKQQLLKLETTHESHNNESIEYHNNSYLIAQTKHSWESTFNRLRGDLNIPDLLRKLDLYYSQMHIEIQNRYLLQQKAIQLNDLKYDDQVQKETLSQSCLFEILTEINHLLKQEEPTIEAFQHLLELLKKYENRLSFEALVSSYTYVRNFCTLLINGGSTFLEPTLHEINKDNLQRGYFYFNGKISPHALLNLVQVAIRVGEVAWAKAFIQKHKDGILGGDTDEIFYKLCMANCLFAEDNFQEVLNILPDTPSGFHYHQSIRRLELKVYYETGSDLLLYKVDSFRKFIERTAPKLIADEKRQMNLNFLKILHQLAQSPPKDKARSARLIKRIEEKKFIAERSWLLEKARELG